LLVVASTLAIVQTLKCEDQDQTSDVLKSFISPDLGIVKLHSCPDTIAYYLLILVTPD